MLVTNYFIGFMICIFSILYFIGYLILKTDKLNIKDILCKCLLFGGGSLLAGGLGAILLLPLFFGMSSISATGDMWPTSQYYAFTFIEFLANHFTGVGSTVFSSGISNAANISVGILGIALFFLFFVNPKITIKTKIIYSLLLSIFIASFFWVSLDFIWHAFHVPNDLPYRYSFLYSFILLIICAYSLINIKEVNVKLVTIVYAFVLFLLSLLLFFGYKNIETNMIYLNYLLITAYYVIYLIYKYVPNVKKPDIVV